MNYTTIEQSKKLLELGLSPETADMCYGSISYDSPGPYCEVAKTHKPDLEFNDLPCWSIGALIELIPVDVKTHSFYKGATVYVYFREEPRKETADTLLGALFNSVVWLIENTYALNPIVNEK